MREPYELLDTGTFYVSGDNEEGPYKAAKSVLKAARKVDPSPTSISLNVQYIPAGADGEPAYWSATITTSI